MLKTTNIYYLIVTVSRVWKQISWWLWLRASPKAAKESWLGLWSHSKALLGEHQLPYWLLHGAAHNLVAGFLSEKEKKDGSQSFCNLILEVASHFLCHILFIRSKSLGTAHIQVEGETWISRGEWAFPVGPVAKTSHCPHWGPRFEPWSGN